MKRPIIWVFCLLLAVFLIRVFMYGRQLDAKCYILDDKFKRTTNAVAIGQIARIETKPKSIYIYLNHVSVILSNENTSTYNLDNLLVMSQQILPDTYAIGNTLQIHGKLQKLLPATNPGQFNEKNYYREQNIYYKIAEEKTICVESSKNVIKDGLYKTQKKIQAVYEECLAQKDAGVISAMLLGDKASLDMDIKELYKRNGIGHILAISGLHISILSMLIYKLLTVLRLPRPVPLCMTTVFLYLYGEMTGFSISTSRAVLMMLFMLLAKEIGRSYDAITAMGYGAIIILFQKPYALFSCSFLLSYSAVFGVVLVVPLCKGMVYGTLRQQDNYNRNRHRKMKEAQANISKLFYSIYQLWYRVIDAVISLFICSVSIWIMTLPILLYFYYEVPTYGIFINLFVLPIVSVLVVIAIIGGICGFFFLPLAKMILYPLHIILKFYENICNLFLELPSPVQVFGRPALFQIIVYYCVVIFLILILTETLYYEERFQKTTKRLSVIFLAVSLFFLCYRKGITSFECTMLDVGQGDGIVLRTNDKKTILIDGGSTDTKEVGRYRLLPFFKYYGIRTIDYMIMTHSDEDHISGQLELMEFMSEKQIVIKNYLVPEPAKEIQDDNYIHAVNTAIKTGVNVSYIHAGDILQFEKLSLYCIHPAKDFATDSANAYSTTLSLTYQDFSMLLTGDLEGNGEESVIETIPQLQQNGTLPQSYNVLKAAHHGSKNSTTTELLKLIKPKLALISCGYENRYGHPHEELLKRLREAHTDYARTDECGAITITSDPNLPIKRQNMHDKY